jgi:hypothetical protein
MNRHVVLVVVLGMAVEKVLVKQKFDAESWNRQQ